MSSYLTAIDIIIIALNVIFFNSSIKELFSTPLSCK